jgi:hypothetical protein
MAESGIIIVIGDDSIHPRLNGSRFLIKGVIKISQAMATLNLSRRFL